MGGKGKGFRDKVVVRQHATQSRAAQDANAYTFPLTAAFCFLGFMQHVSPGSPS